MNAMSILQIATWGARAVQAIIEVIAAAVNGPEPPTLDELRAKVQAALDAHHDNWMKTARADADEVLRKSAAAEFDAELAAEVKKP
jgi:hypothetical protein